MDEFRFDAWTRRRLGLTAGRAAAALLGFTAMSAPDAVQAKKKTKKKLKLNSFGCVDVGGACQGKDANCCSGRCQGKKPKQGKKDRSKCLAHHVGGCQADQDVCRVGALPPQCGADGRCFRTTGRASFCGVSQDDLFNPCASCKKDADCTTEFGPGATCVVCAGECLAPGTACIPAAV